VALNHSNDSYEEYRCPPKKMPVYYACKIATLSLVSKTALQRKSSKEKEGQQSDLNSN